MGVQISAQLLLFAQSILLGLAAGAVYGVLRPCRCLLPRLAPALDLLFGLGLAAACTAFLLRPADGVLRGYAVLGMAGGAVVWFCGPDAFLRPLWGFWADTAACLVRAALLPGQMAVRLLRSLLESGKSLFYFAEKCCTIGTAELRRGRERQKHYSRNAGRQHAGRQNVSRQHRQNAGRQNVGRQTRQNAGRRNAGRQKHRKAIGGGGERGKADK